jgi:hypothetical protein
MAQINDGDWIEGKVEWWWKYVIPAESQFWAAILAERAQRATAQLDPEPAPWRHAQARGLEAVAMLQALHGIADPKQRNRLLAEIGERFHSAEESLNQTAVR